MKLLRTIRLDPSDTFVFERAAEPGEWAVSGAFAFWNGNPEQLEGKARTAFRGGFLGVDSLGRSTLVQIVEATEAGRAGVVETLARALLQHFGAPDLAAARAAAEEEVAFAASLCDHPTDTLVAVHRTFEDGAVRETFRTLRPRAGAPSLRAFSFLDVEGEDEEPTEQVDLAALAKRESQADLARSETAKMKQATSDEAAQPWSLRPEEFAKISAVEGISLTDEMKQAFADFERRGLSDEERRREIIGRYMRMTN